MSIFRYIHTAQNVLNSAVAIEKSALAKLRRATGYSFSKCKEALEKHDNDLKQAEKWLTSQAQAHGWEKATKLQGRATAQGLVSILANPNTAVMIEVNCETDFVARNKKFQALVQRITQSSYLFSNEQHQPGETLVSKVTLSGEDVANLPLAESKSIKDDIALGIGGLGENIKARRAVYLRSGERILLAGYTHPAAADGAIVGKDVVQYGKYGAIVAYRKTNASNKSEKNPNPVMAEVGRQLCQHIVGMNPKEIGNINELPKAKERETESSEPVQQNAEESDEPVFRAVPEVEESVLINQEFLLDPDITVRDFLIQNSVEVVDFVRFECGENTEPSHLE